MSLLFASTLLVVVAQSAANDPADQCIDNDAEIVKLAADAGETINGCADVGGWCADLGQYGLKARELCCDQCGGNEAGDADLSMSLPPANDTDPVHLFLLSGQSECVGQAQANDLNWEGKDAYPNLGGRQNGVWFARSTQGADFTITEMEAVNKFGPEISFGQRVHEVTGARVMVVKYCWGGSSVSAHWNPTSSANDWDKEADDGTAAWLKNNAGVNFQNKNALFVNQVYTKRRTIEALDAAGVAYEWKAFVWVQGSADKLDPWEDIGTNTARVFDYTREQVGVWDLPVLDTGSSAQHALRSGKEYATQIVKGCNSVVIESGSAAENPDSTCQITPTNVCLEDTFMDFRYMDHYGWDPNWSAELKPEWASDRVFRWFVAFPSNQHSAYEGMILKGRMLANAYIRSFTTIDLPPAFAKEDPTLLFPWSRCAPGAKPTAEKLCWVDLRGKAQAAKACVPQPPVAASTDPTPSPDEETTDSPASSAAATGTTPPTSPAQVFCQAVLNDSTAAIKAECTKWLTGGPSLLSLDSCKAVQQASLQGVRAEQPAEIDSLCNPTATPPPPPPPTPPPQTDKTPPPVSSPATDSTVDPDSSSSSSAHTTTSATSTTITGTSTTTTGTSTTTTGTSTTTTTTGTRTTTITTSPTTTTVSTTINTVEVAPETAAAKTKKETIIGASVSVVVVLIITVGVVVVVLRKSSAASDAAPARTPTHASYGNPMYAAMPANAVSAPGSHQKHNTEDMNDLCV